MLDEDHREQSDTCSCVQLIVMYMISFHIEEIIH